MASELLKLQWEFARMLPRLIDKAHELGYECSVGDAYRDPRLHGELGVSKGYGHRNSCHKVRLAFDLNLYKGGAYITDGTGHKELHKFWSELGGSDLIPNDLNHYSIEYKGCR